MTKLKIMLIKSPIGSIPNHRANLRGLGLSRIRQSVLRENTPNIRGMIAKVIHLLQVEEVKK
jgi:large subunit ribosomal protein L30